MPKPRTRKVQPEAWEGALPSHLLPVQVAALRTCSRQAVAERMDRGTLPAVAVLGIRMIPTHALIEMGEIPPTPHASTPSAVADLLARALDALVSGHNEDKLFTADELVGLYLSFNRSWGGQ